MRPKLELLGAKKPVYQKVDTSIYLNTSNGYYYVRKSFKRYRIPALFESTKERTLGKARAKADVLISEHLSRYLGGSSLDLASKRVGKPMREIIDEVLATVTPTKRIGTQENHRTYLGQLAQYWGTWDVNRITLPAWQEWLKGFREKKKRKTYADYAKNMNLVLRYAYMQKYASHLIRIPNPDPIGEVTGRVFTRQEIKALWRVMNEETRDQFVLCYECFMRLREALYLTWDRVDLKTGVVTLRAQDVKTGSKTGRGRSFHLSDHALKRMRARRKRGGDTWYVFPSPTDASRPVDQNKDAWSRAKKKAKIQGRARWHDLRHTALTRALLEEGVDPVQVSEFAGVSLRTIQRVYLHSTHEKTRGVAKAIKIFG